MEFSAKCPKTIFGKIVKMFLTGFLIYGSVTQLMTHLATSISFRCGLSTELSHNNCSAISALFLRSVGSTTYELLATPETEPVTKITQVLGNKFYCSRPKGEKGKKSYLISPTGWRSSPHTSGQKENHFLCAHSFFCILYHRTMDTIKMSGSKYV